MPAPAPGGINPPDTAHLEPAGSGSLALVWGAARSLVMRPTRPVGPDLARVKVAIVQGQSWALVRWGTGESKSQNAVWAFVKESPSKLRLLWQGTDGALDGDGETQSAVDLSAAGLMRLYSASWLRRCDGKQPVWRSEVFDPSLKQFKPSNLVPWLRASDPNAPQLAIALAAPSLNGKPWPSTVADTFRFSSASSPAVADARALPSPAVLDDHAVATSWDPFVQNTPGAAFATARSATAVNVMGIAFTKNSAVPWPTNITIHMGVDSMFSLDMAQAAGDHVWLAFPKSIDTSCVTVDVATLALPTQPSLNEIQIVTALDGQSGIEFAAKAILNASDCGRALRVVGSHLPATELAKQLVNGLAFTSSTGQACALQALAALPIQSVAPTDTWLPAVLPTVLAAYGQVGVWKDEALVFWLARGQAPAAQALLKVIRDETQVSASRGLAAKLLATSALAANRRALLDIVGRQSAETNALVRDALANNFAGIAEVLDEAIAKQGLSLEPAHAAELLWLRSKAPAASKAETPVWMETVKGWARSNDTDFAVRARSLLLLGNLSNQQAFEVLLHLGQRDADAVIRHLAFESLSSNILANWSPGTETTLRAGLVDPDPRVRQSTARIWAQLPAEKVKPAAEILLRAYQSERWSFVMSAHLGSIAKACIAEAPLVAASTREDLPTDAKITALEGLAACKFKSARQEALFALKRQAAPVSLREAAAEVLLAVGQKEDGPTLFRVLKQAASGAAADPSLDDVVASTLQTLVQLDKATGADAALFLVAQTRPRLRRSGMTALGAVCTPSARGTIERELGSTDSWLANAAKGAKAQCNKLD